MVQRSPGTFCLPSRDSTLPSLQTEMTFSVLDHLRVYDYRLTICVLCAYNGQLQDIIEENRELRRPHDVTFRTVDSSQVLSLISATVSVNEHFQGSEFDIVIFVTTRSNSSCNVGFLDTSNRVNVAMSRARYALIIIGDAIVSFCPLFLRSNSTYRLCFIIPSGCRSSRTSPTRA